MEEETRTLPAVRLMVSAPGVAPRRFRDPTLITLLAKAPDWLSQLTSGRGRSLAAIAKGQRVTTSYVSRVIHLALLAPDILQCIARGEQPSHLNSKRLLREVPLPSDWAEQRALLGFER